MSVNQDIYTIFLRNQSRILNPQSDDPNTTYKFLKESMRKSINKKYKKSLSKNEGTLSKSLKQKKRLIPKSENTIKKNINKLANLDLTKICGSSYKILASSINQNFGTENDKNLTNRNEDKNRNLISEEKNNEDCKRNIKKLDLNVFLRTSRTQSNTNKASFINHNQEFTYNNDVNNDLNNEDNNRKMTLNELVQEDNLNKIKNNDLDKENYNFYSNRFDNLIKEISKTNGICKTEPSLNPSNTLTNKNNRNLYTSSMAPLTKSFYLKTFNNINKSKSRKILNKINDISNYIQNTNLSQYTTDSIKEPKTTYTKRKLKLISINNFNNRIKYFPNLTECLNNNLDINSKETNNKSLNINNDKLKKCIKNFKYKNNREVENFKKEFSCEKAIERKEEANMLENEKRKENEVYQKLKKIPRHFNTFNIYNSNKYLNTNSVYSNIYKNYLFSEANKENINSNLKNDLNLSKIRKRSKKKYNSICPPNDYKKFLTMKELNLAN